MLFAAPAVFDHMGGMYVVLLYSHASLTVDERGILEMF